MHDFPTDGSPWQPQLQRYRDYARQRQMTLGDLLLENRIIFIGSAGSSVYEPVINDITANIIIQQLLFLQYENKNQEIHFYINSPGGSVSSTLAIYDTMQFLECPISTYCMGLAASGAAVILAAGTKGKRYILPNAKVMVHEPWGQVGGQVSDIEILATEISKERAKLNDILAKHTGRTVAEIELATSRDKYLDAHEAKEFGLVDEVLIKSK
ncbi:MAG TPA: ATP-dependent Clp protease proteolytic subunit [Gemmataceae bacterium]|nr:ATP-dependent Clp protease proteolytic subunit [Gemmataceae bacterium]